MLSYTPPTHPHRSFMTLTGVICALVNAGTFLALLWIRDDVEAPEFLNWVPLLLAAVAFFCYTRFSLLISARNMLWMLGRGVLCWCNVLFFAVCSLFFLPHDTIDTLLDPKWPRSLLLHWIAIALPLQIITLYFLRRAAYRINNASSSRRTAVFFGMGPEARKLTMRLQRSPILGIYTAGYYAEAPVIAGGGVTLPKYLGSYQDALPQIQAGKFSMAFVALDDAKGNPQTTSLMNSLYDSTSAIYLVPESPFLTDMTTSSADIAGVPLLAVHETHMVGLSRSIKRGMDLILGSLMLLAALPVMLMIVIAIRLDSPGPVIFRQIRYGERGQPFTVFKFRSMRTDAGREADGTLRQAQVGDARITRVGSFLRKSSLDELPQLFNVILGSMSLVGPRPHAAEHNELYRHLIRGYMLRHSVKPGITGWAQINGLRGETDTPEKMQRRVAFDLYYITNWSLRLDLKILCQTVLLIAWDRNAY